MYVDRLVVLLLVDSARSATSDVSLSFSQCNKAHRYTCRIPSHGGYTSAGTFSTPTPQAFSAAG